VTQIPIACTLSAADKTTRGDEWRQFFVDNVEESVRSETSVRLRLKNGDDVILNAVDLARREKDCCAFFEFRLELLPDVVWLEIGVPADAAAILDALISPGTAGTLSQGRSTGGA
jgi:MerR family transcriptional regulator, copper efflux regulator